MSRSLVRVFDRGIASLVEHIPKKWEGFFARLSLLTHPTKVAVVLALLLVLSFIARQDSTAILIATLLLALPIEQLLKMLFRRPRPQTIYVDTMKIRSYSFPSGHSYAAALLGVVAGGIALAYASLFIASMVILLLSLTVSAIGISRIYLGAHFPSDVVIGWLLGSVIGLIIVQQLVFL